jgi:hypothetical protein
MSPIAPPRKKLEELVARYRLEPAIRDVFVEGKPDADLITRFLKAHRLHNVVVYEISGVEIPPRPLIEAGLFDSARGRVIFLAFHFQDSLSIGSRTATCVADRDYDVLLEKNYNCPFLLFLDHSSLEMYSFDPETLDCVLRAVAPTLGKNGETVLAELESVLQRLFTIRTTNILLNLRLEWLPSFPDSCTLREGSIEFDEDDFINRYLNKNARLGEKGRFMRELEIVRSKMRGDRRLFIRGHDFVAALAWYLRKSSSKSSSLHRPEVLQELLLAYIDPSRILTQRFFCDLVARVGNSVALPAEQI